MVSYIKSHDTIFTIKSFSFSFSEYLAISMSLILYSCIQYYLAEELGGGEFWEKVKTVKTTQMMEG